MRALILIHMLFAASLAYAGGGKTNSFFSNHYIGFESGYSYTLRPNNTFSTSSTEDAGQFGFFAGSYIANNVRLELETNYKTKFTAETSSGTKSDQEFESFACLFNLYKHWNYKGGDQISVFVLGGAGIVYNLAGNYKTYNIATGNITTELLGKDMMQFAYQVGSGVSVKVNEFTFMDFSLRFLDRGSAETTNTLVSAVGGISFTDKEVARLRDVIGLVNVRIFL